MRRRERVHPHLVSCLNLSNLRHPKGCSFPQRGGSGRYTFSLVPPAEGEINASTGVYLAPELRGLTDQVLVRDERCTGEAGATVTVGEGFSVLPTVATVLPGTSFTLEIEGGTGDYRCLIEETLSGATLTEDCVYTAGLAEGVDRLEVRDPRVDAVRTVTVTVDEDARLDCGAASGGPYR